MRTAFKEWAVIVEALGRGTQILIFRKGGISDPGGEFHPDHHSFLLFPTCFHQQRTSIVESAQTLFDTADATGPGDKVRLEYYAEVAAQHRLDSLSQAGTLRGQHIWRDAVVAKRLHWGKDNVIHVLALRVFRLPQPVELPMNSIYAGCKSWVELVQDISTDGAVPVLSDTEFQAKLGQFHAALQPTFAAAS